MGDDYDNIIETIAGLESKIGWRHEDNDAEKRNKRDWFAPNQNEDVLSVVPVSGLFLAVIVTHHRMYLLQSPE